MNLQTYLESIWPRDTRTRKVFKEICIFWGVTTPTSLILYSEFRIMDRLSTAKTKISILPVVSGSEDILRYEIVTRASSPTIQLLVGLTKASALVKRHANQPIRMFGVFPAANRIALWWTVVFGARIFQDGRLVENGKNWDRNFERCMWCVWCCQQLKYWSRSRVWDSLCWTDSSSTQVLKIILSCFNSVENMYHKNQAN